MTAEQKPLAGDIARCPGRAHDSPGGLIFADECFDCRRRSPPVSDYQPWVTPQPYPCELRISP